MSWMEGIGVELMLFGLIWLGWNLATRNLRDFFDLRLRVRRHIERMADRARSETEPAAAVVTCGELGYELLRFADRAPLSARLARLLGYDAVKAGDQLVSLARDGYLVFHCRSVARALRFHEDETSHVHGMD
jgi:hypothetical protein